jgi:hypothetical protein
VIFPYDLFGEFGVVFQDPGIVMRKDEKNPPDSPIHELVEDVLSKFEIIESVIEINRIHGSSITGVG